MIYKVSRLQTIKSLRYGAVIEDFFQIGKTPNVTDMRYNEGLRAAQVWFRNQKLPLTVPDAGIAGMVVETEELFSSSDDPEVGHYNDKGQSLIEPPEPPKKPKARQPGLIPEEDYAAKR